MDPDMDMVRGPRIAEAGLTDWRKLAQWLQARYLVDDLGAAARFVAAIAAALAAGGTVVDDSEAPGLTVLADQDGNRGIICVDTSAVSGS